MSERTEKQIEDRNKIVEYLTEFGETAAPRIDVPGLSAKAIMGICARMAEDGVLSRRVVDHGSRVAWAYSVTGKIPVEPEHIYILRNLPKFPLSEEACQQSSPN
jgi:plasmid stabilization system protein ParE